MFSYLQPYKSMVLVTLLLVLGITAIELLRPVIIGDAIDLYINGYDTPYIETNKGDNGAFAYRGTYLKKAYDIGENTEDSYWQIILYQNNYYLFQDITKQEQEMIANTNSSSDLNFQKMQGESQKEANLSVTVNGKAVTGYLLRPADLKILRQTDFIGILKAAGIYFVLLILLVTFSMLQYWIMQKIGQKVIYRIRQDLFAHVQNLSMRYFDLTPIGKIVTRITNDVEALNDMYANILVRLFKNIVKIIGIALVMISINGKMALLSFFMVPIVFLLTVLFKKISREAYRLTRTRITNLNTFLSENLSGMKLIQIFVREKEKYDDFKERSMALYQANFREIMVFAIFRPTIYMVSIFALIIVLGGGGNFVLNHTLSIGTLFIFVQYISNLFDPIQELAEQFSTLQSAIASAEKIFQVLDEKPLIVERESPTSIPKVKGKIEFKNVWFAYENDDYILKDVSFTIEPGEKVAFVGATGAGKSSILNLIGRYYDIQKGEILIDGVNIKNLRLDELRAAIGQVQQDVFLFTGDIKSNIRLLDENISEKEILDAASSVNASKFIQQLPHKFEEKVTERGATFSAGQRQLISFARTLAHNPTILVMDEATSNIDTETEIWIQEALETLMDGRTTIMVAHRLSTIQHADNIIVMHKGEIRESGTHQELLKKDGIYKKLYELQLA